jgi:hypothetical protein
MSPPLSRRAAYRKTGRHLPDLLIDENAFDAFESLFKKRYAINACFPHRSQFQDNEFVAYNAMMGRSFLLREKPAIAKTFFDMIRQVAPDHPILQSELVVGTGFFARLKSLFNSLRSSRREHDDAEEDADVRRG